MGANTKNSLADAICPTYAAGTNANISQGAKAFNNDSACPGQPNGYQNTLTGSTVGSFNNDWINYDLTQSVAPTYSSAGLLSFGRTGLQS